MRPWLLLASLLVSDLCPLGDGGDRVVENHSWSLYRKWLLNGRGSPRGLEVLQTRTGRCCRICIQGNCMFVTMQHKQRTSPLCWVYRVQEDHGCSLSHRKFTGIMQRNRLPALVVPLRPAFLVKSQSKTLHQATLVGGKTSHTAVDTVEDHPGLGSAWVLHHHRAASGQDFQAFLLEKSTTIVEALTKRCCAVIISCLKEAVMRSAWNIKKISKQQPARPQIRREESTQRAVDMKVPTERDGQRLSKAVVSQRDIFQAATLRSGKTSDTSRLEVQRNAVRVIKKKEHVNSDEEPLALIKRVQRQQSLRAASSVYNDDGFYGKRQLLLVSGEKTESINRPRYKMRATQDDNKEDFSGRIITKQAGRPGGQSETQQSRTNTIENGNQRRLAYIRRDSAHKADNNDHEQMLAEVREEVLIMLFLPDTQTEPLSARKLQTPNADIGWKTVNIHIKELNDPPAVTKVIKENFIIEPDKSKRNCLKERPILLEIYALQRIRGTEIKPAESTAKATTASANTEAQETTEKTERTETNNPPNTSSNPTKHEEDVPSQEPVIPSTPLIKIMATEAPKPEHKAETTTANVETKETSSVEVFTQASTQEVAGPPSTETPKTTMRPESETQPNFMRPITYNNPQATSAKIFFGLKMREDIPAGTTELHKGTEDEGRTRRPGDERKLDSDDPKTEGDGLPLCGGLIHRSEAGWRLCVERLTGTPSKTFPSTHPPTASQDEEEHELASITARRDNPPRDEEYEHFYYFDGVLKRVQNNIYPYDKPQRLRRESADHTGEGAFEGRDARENLLAYIRRLTLRNRR